MNLGTRCFILNRQSDWEEDSYIENLEFKDDMMFSQSETSANGVYISSSFDSGQAETVWHRLRIDMDIPQNVQLRLKIYSSDSLEIDLPKDIDYHNVSNMNLDEYLLSKDIDYQMKFEVLNALGAKTFDNPTDLVLYEFKGRYLWFAMEVINYSSQALKIEKLKIEYPRISFINYLPQIYRGGVDKNTFLARYLSIFQSIYVDFEDEIDNIPVIFDPEKTDPVFLEWLTQWFSVENSYIWGEEKLRKLLKRVISIYKKKGTKKALSDMIETYIGIRPIIVEQFSVVNNDYYRESKEHIETLYGSNKYVFSVIIPAKDHIGPETYAELLRIINMMKPIDSICNLVVLNNEIYLDHHCYLGVNTYTSKSEQIVLENHASSDEPDAIYLTGSQNI